MLYLWQIALLRPHVVHRAASWLGLYILSSSDSFPVLAPRLLHLTALVALFGALGYHAGGDQAAAAADDPSTRVRVRLSYMMAPAASVATPHRGRSAQVCHISLSLSAHPAFPKGVVLCGSLTRWTSGLPRVF